MHLSNGDATQLPESGVDGPVVFWRDALHDGPVPAGLSLAELSARRAAYIASRGWSPDYDTAARSFAERDAALCRHADYDEIVLWFEHDLYDQLQLVQILQWFSQVAGRTEGLSLVCIDRHPEIERFCGLGQLSPAQLAALFPERRPVTGEQAAVAARTWSAFTATTPVELCGLLAADTTALPFLAAALRRLLQQYPSVEHGLARTEWQLLASIRNGASTLGRAFAECQDAEEAPFMGDWCFATDYVSPLMAGPAALIEVHGGSPIPWRRKSGANLDFWRQPVAISADAQAVLNGEHDGVEHLGLDRWLGGHHLTGKGEAWRWDKRAGAVITV